MKKVLLFFAIVTLSAMQSFAQDSKFYIGIGAGYATAGGDAADELDASAGINLNFLNIGYRFSESWGLTANLGSSGHSIADTDNSIGVGALSFGPMYTVSLTENMSWDLKPQYVASMKGVLVGDDLEAAGLDEFKFSGNGFMFGNSLVFGDGSKGFDFSIDLDYLMGKFNEFSVSGVTVDIDEDNSFNSFKIGVGLRYNF
jgi:hypothetical protein